MPRYTYACQACSAIFSARFSYAEVDEAHPACPECGSTTCERMLSSVHFCVGNTAASGGSTAAASGSGCAGCAGGHCSTCH
jgi:putative FmdB family regulatory protein